MPSPFAITPSADTVAIDANRRGEVAFTVSNTSAAPVRSRGKVVAGDPAQQAWYSLAGNPERPLKPGETTQYVVRVALPQTATEGTYQFRLDAVSVENPDEMFTTGQPVGFTFKPPAEPPKKPFPWWILAVVGGALLIIGVVLFFVLRNTDVTVPDLKNMTYEEAVDALTQAGLEAEEIQVVAGGPENKVSGQDPAPDTQVPKNSVVKVTHEAAFVEVPALVRTQIDDVAEALKARKLAQGTVAEVKRDVSKAGLVLEQDPAAGTRVPAGTAVAVVAEAPLRKVPTDLVGKKTREVVERLSADFEVKVGDPKRSDRTKAGQVLASDPRGGTVLQRGDVVNLDVEAGNLTLMSVVGLAPDKAIEELRTKQGLKSKIGAPALLPVGAPGVVGKIGYTNPPPNSDVAETDTIEIIPIGAEAKMPDGLIGLVRDQAEAAVTRAHLKPVVRLQFDRLNSNKVLRIDPAANTRLLAESPVTIYVGSSHVRFPRPGLVDAGMLTDVVIPVGGTGPVRRATGGH